MHSCYYCGEELTFKTLSWDHVKARKNGGSNSRRNLVPACNVCNSIKGDRPLERMRHRLVQKMLGWPKFTQEQLDWLRDRGFDMAEYDGAKLAFERKIILK